MGRFRLGLKLAGESWRVLRGHPALLAFPLAGTVLAILLVAPPALAGAYLLEEGSTVPGIALLVLAAYLAAFVTAFMAVGLVATADVIMRGAEEGFGYGLRTAMSHLGAISGWALINATLSLALGALESRGAAGQIAGSLVGGAWSVISLLAVPAIALEDAGPIQAIKRSASIFRERWAGQVTGMAAIGGLVFLLGVLPGVLLAILGFAVLSGGGGGGELAAGEVMIALGVLIAAVALLISAALRQVFAAALYRYATTGEAPPAFAEEDLRSAVRSRGAQPATA